MNLRVANETWEAVLGAHANLMRGFASEDIWCDLQMNEYDVLYTLAKAKTPLRLSELQHGVLLSQPALSRLVERLETRRLIERSVDAVDRRALQVALTEKGRELQKKIGRAHARSVNKSMSALSTAELETLKSLALKLTELNETKQTKLLNQTKNTK